ncbi:GlsB/YeaQ/YmgE family stress response membrane protein [Imbroritus primus]|uniref:GlsB/YeaQ/YmgE family stress response membrane protein n=1 Tax=Imbroritus primus TaxID=3058603 RepID=A0ACD3SSK5_9BURK|nr:GlsB/YeaQ/YmgE family stress response membrane protein [Burkholderiaceae bacterium PBA]
MASQKENILPSQANVKLKMRPMCRGETMGWLGTVLVGMVVGLAGRATHPARPGIGWGISALLGGIAALLAKYGGQAAGLYVEGDMAGWIAAIVAPTLIVLVYGMFAGRRR